MTDQDAAPAAVACLPTLEPETPLLIQARQLADYLERRQQDLDRREARLNAQSAELQTDLRAARLWFSERTIELDQRDARLAELARALDEREAQFSAREEALSAAEAQQAMRARCDVEAPPTAAPAENAAHAAELRALRSDLETRLAAAESTLAELERGQADLAAVQRELAQERAEHDAHVLARRQELAQAELEWRTRLDEARQNLKLREQELDRRAAAGQQLQAQLEQVHRETLELRLATEELWAQLSGRVQPQWLAGTLGEIRRRLADHYQLARSELGQRRQELELMRPQIESQVAQLARRRQELQCWLARRQEELAQAAEALEERQKSLARREAELHRQCDEWRAERTAASARLRHWLRQLETSALAR